MNKARLLSITVAILILVNTFSVISSAACAHANYSPQYSEATHPHAYFKQCLDCGYILYTGGHATKAHGDGSWGSGTCPSCGTHTYTGQSCTSQGICSCGAMSSVLGHSYSPEYCEADHPHAVYKQCYRCGVKSYTGQYTTKPHGSGAQGSGTCPDCGTHSYSGSYYSSVHPHEIYSKCSVCGHKNYTGEYYTKEHGDGAQGSGTCPDCGTHLFLPDSSSYSHPHEVIVRCACGETNKSYPLDRFCVQCNSITEEAYAIVSRPVVFSLWEADGVGVGATAVPFTYHVEYRNTYSYPSDHDPMNWYNYPEFASFMSGVSSYVDDLPPLHGDIYTISDRTANYYLGNGALLYSELMAYGNNMSAVSTALRTFDVKPGYAIGGAQCSSGPQFVNVDVIAYFQ